jgi:hypothetical protein
MKKSKRKGASFIKLFLLKIIIKPSLSLILNNELIFRPVLSGAEAGDV